MSCPQPCSLAPGPRAVLERGSPWVMLSSPGRCCRVVPVLQCHQGCNSLSLQHGAVVLSVDGHCVLAKVVRKGVPGCTAPAEPSVFFFPGNCCVTTARTTRQRW